MKKILDKYKTLSIQAKAALWFLVCSVIQKGISVITTPIFTRLMSTSDYGEFNVFTSWQGIVTAVVILTLPWGVFTPGLIKFDQKKNEFTSALLGLMTTLTIIWLILYIIFRSFWNKVLGLSTVMMLAMFALIWATSVFDFWSMRQRVAYKYQKLVVLTLIISFLNPVIGIICVRHSSNKAAARALSMTIIDLFIYFGLFISMIKEGRVFYSKKIWSYGLKFNIPLIPHYLSQRVLNNADRIMIKSMVSASASGIYSLAYSISLIMMMVNTSLSQALSPWILKKIKDKKIEDIQGIAFPAVLIVGVMNLLLIGFAPEVVKIFAPVEYYDSIWVIPPIAMSVFFTFLYDLFSNVEFYYEKTKNMSIATLIGAVLNIILNYIFINIFGYYAAGYTTLACYIIYAICHYIFMNNICKKYLDGKHMFDLKMLIFTSLIFMLSGFGIMFTYKLVIVRYIIIFTIIITVFALRNKIKIFLLSLKK